MKLVDPWARGYFMVPFQLCDMVGVTAATVFARIAKHCEEDGACFASKIHLAEELGVHRNTVTRHVNTLIELGYVEEIGCHDSSSIYRVLTWGDHRSSGKAKADYTDYQEYLKSPEWDVRRKKAYAMAGYRCQLCNKKGQLHAHHRTYERLGHEKDTDIIVLCSRCHATFHKKI